MGVQVQERVADLVDSSKGGCILVEAEAGMGKSRLLEEIQQSTFGGTGQAVTCVRATASTAHRSQVSTPSPPQTPSVLHHSQGPSSCPF